MADFFSRLAERTLGVTPVARPNLPSAFAPQPRLETGVEVVAAQPANPLSTQSDNPRAAVDSPPSDESAPSRAPERQPTETQFRRPPVSSLPSEERRDGKLSAETFAVTVESSDTNTSRRSLAADASSYHATSAPIAEREPRGVIAEHIVTRPARAAVSDFDTFSPRRSDSAPSVQVTIGRVEVRAVMPPAPAPRAMERRSPSMLSLDEYLRQRNGGRR